MARKIYHYSDIAGMSPNDGPDAEDHPASMPMTARPVRFCASMAFPRSIQKTKASSAPHVLWKRSQRHSRPKAVRSPLPMNDPTTSKRMWLR